MNDDTDKPLNPVGDAALEARITAWVLGEASPFEAAELEEICARDPEARLFERRLRVLHGFIVEDRKAGADDEWKLPAEKRAKIEALFEEPVVEKEEVSEQPKIVHRGQGGRRALLALAACTVISAAAWSLFGTIGVSEKSALTMQMEAPQEEVEFSPGGGAGGGLGYGGGVGVQEDRYAYKTPASPAVSAPAPAAQPAGEMDSLAAVERKSERGQAVDESLAKLAEEPAARRSKSSASVSPAKKPATSYLHLSQNSPMTTKPALKVEERADMPRIESAATAPAAATGAIASNDFADHDTRGKELAFGRDAKPAEMEADASDRYAWSPRNAPANSSFDLQARFRGEASSPDSMPLFTGPVSPAFADVDTDYFSSGGRLAIPGQSRTNADFIAGMTIPGAPAKSNAEVSDIVTAGNRSGLGAINRNSIDAILENPDRPADAAGAADALADNEAIQMEGGFKDSGKASEFAEAKGDEQSSADRSFAGKSIDTALAQQHERNTDEIRRKLYTAEGNYNLGKFEDAHKAYEDVIRLDPYNKAARRGMEQVAQARSDYYRAAYDQTRAQLLTEADGASQLAVPPTEEKGLKDSKELDGTASDKTRAQLLAEVDRAWDLAVPPTTSLNDLKELEAAKKVRTPEELVPRLEKAIREEEEKLQQDPNSVEDQNQIQLLAKVRDDLRGKIDAKAKEAEKQEKAPEPVALAETLTSAEPFSTFSLHVSDASFKMAKAALDRGEVPAADGIRPEEFYNAFDYGDPAPANGEPVVCAVEQSAHPALPQRNLLRIGVKTGSQGRGGSTPLNLTLLLDSSGSMEREDRNAGLANAVRQLSGLLKEGDTVSVIGFARQPRLLVDRLPGNRAQELNAIFAQTPSEGGTNLEEGLKLGEQLALRQFNAAAQNRIVLFTDGAANLGDAKPETLQAKVEQMRQNGIAFDAAGFGTDGLNDKLLERLTRNGNGRYYIVDRAEDADANFAKQLAGAFRPAAENVKVQVRFNPARVAKYKLIGFEEHRLKKEDFRNDAVDAAEMAAEEAGNALYQIEALPQGEGEVGEVSVRFRDVASGQMVERTWTIPYEAQAASFDQATPSIQLAGLAAFAAEKLRGAPMAGAVDFQQLAPVVAKVKARYTSSKPVAELEAMIGKLK